MTCLEPARFCLGDHIAPHLGAKKSGGKPDQYRAHCPAHYDRKASLSIGIGEQSRRIEWRCFAECPEADVRAAMVAAGVPDGCLHRVRGQRSEDELVAALTPILEAGPSYAGWLRLAAVVWNRGRLPRGRELVALGARLGLSRSAVYRVTDSPRSGTNVTDTRRIGSPASGTAVPEVGLSVTHPDVGQHAGFGVSVTPGVRTSVALEPPDRAPLSVTPVSVTSGRCEWCGGWLEPSRAGARQRYCTPAHRQRAHRARLKAKGEPPPAGRWAAREPGGGVAGEPGSARHAER